MEEIIETRIIFFIWAKLRKMLQGFNGFIDYKKCQGWVLFYGFSQLLGMVLQHLQLQRFGKPIFFGFGLFYNECQPCCVFQ